MERVVKLAPNKFSFSSPQLLPSDEGRCPLGRRG